MIKLNGEYYVRPGEDNPNGYDYYTEVQTENVYDIKKDGELGTFTIITTTYYVADEDGDSTNYEITRQHRWKMRYGSKSSNGVAITDNDEYNMYLILQKYRIQKEPESEEQKDTPLDTDNSQQNASDSNAPDAQTADDKMLNGNQNSDERSSNVFNNTTGKNTNNGGVSLPKGADVSKDDQQRPDDQETNYPKENNLANKGTTYPIIRINDQYYREKEIVYFAMETGFYKNYQDYAEFQMPMAGFLPTMQLIVQTSDHGALKKNLVKQGDRCAVYFSANHKMVKSMRCDFRIINVVTDRMDQNVPNRYTTQIIQGELYIPDLRNETVRYNFNGSSRDALMDAAKRLRLSFFFCDPEDTNDVMVWCNCKTPEQFIKELTVHSWKNPDSFFESWIDPRYGLSYINVNKMLGESGYDEPLDATFFINTFYNNRAEDGKRTEKSAEEKAQSDAPQAKILTNISDDEESATTFHVNSWRLINTAQEIQDFVGLNCKQQFESVNPGLDDNSKYAVDFSLCLNRTKFDPTREDASNSFYVLLGPGRNTTYESADATMGVSETQSSNVVAPEKVVNQQSDGDAANILSTNGNMMSSGNTHKFYEVAYEHNMRNLLQLQKQIVEVELNGPNLAILRGEKIPLMLIDVNRADQAIRQGMDRNVLESYLYEAECGWYIIDGIEWVYDPADGGNTGTFWKTKVKLTRREWPIPGKDNRINESGNPDNNLVLVDVGNGQTVKKAYADAMADNNVIIGPANTQEPTTGTLYTGNGTETVTADMFNADMADQYVTDDDKVESSDIPLTGLKDYMKEIYRAIVSASDGKVKLVSARRWAVDQYDNKVNGNAFVKKNGYYKCMNAIGETMYFKTNNSRHLYGEAIDIINNGIDFTELMTQVIMQNGTVLRLMYDNGVSAYIEQAIDDTGASTKHYHIGTDTTKQAEFWASVKAVLGMDKIPGTAITFTNYMRNNNTASTEITYDDIDEATLS